MISKDIEIMLGVAAREAHIRHHEYLSLEHLLFAIIQHQEGAKVITACGGNPDRLKSRIEKFFETHLEKLSGDRNEGPQPTVILQRILQRTIMHVQSAEKEEADIGDLLAAVMTEEDSYAAYFLHQEGITRLDILNFISHGIERTDPYQNIISQRNIGSQAGKQAESSTKPANALDAFTLNLTRKAADGEIDPLVGRKVELERTMQILCRRRKNNPIYVGDPGVGKTALAEGLALKIQQGEVAEPLKGTEMYVLDLGALLAGTKYRGEFEARLKEVINQIKKHPKAILFIDEVHTVVGAGATSGGSMDASNILKPALANGELRCIGSTTYEEYRNFFEKDRALSRRFQKIEILEPTVKETVKILQGLKSYYEEHHGIKYTDSALVSAAELSDRYLTDRYMPDKAIDVIDEAASVLRLSGNGGNRPGLVTTRHIENVIAKIARLPAKTITQSDRSRLEKLEESIKSVVFGQDEAVEFLSKAIKRSRAGLSHPERPIGSFLFIGPTGVGKTELARQTAAVLGVHFQRFDMSEYMEKHAVARLIGAPPGYVGFDQGGLLTEAIRKHPYCVLLLDEIEKAHPDLFSILLQVMDYATLTDNTGKRADFRHVILIMTSNAGAREMESQTIGFGAKAEDSRYKGENMIKQIFSPEFRNRLEAVIPFGQLTTSAMEQIVDKLLWEIQEQLSGRKIKLDVTPAARSWLAQNGYDPQFGARPLARVLQKEIKDPVSDAILFHGLSKGGKIVVDVKDGRLVINK
jgi:ATP-dependent Clp protease ATP-binding subunit ClpA